MYCRYCGKEIADQAVICVHCGAQVQRTPAVKDTGSAGWWWLGFLIPLAGLIIWLIYKDDQPKNARKVGIGALVGVITETVLIILIYVIYIAIMFSVFMSM